MMRFCAIIVMLAACHCAAAQAPQTPPVEHPWLARSPFPDALVVRVSTMPQLQKAAQEAKPGTIIAVRAGNYEGGLTLKDLHGTPQRPILLVSIDGQHAARIVGTEKLAALQVTGISHAGIYGFHIWSRATEGDLGGIKIWGDWEKPARNIVIAGNKVTGKGQDGIKVFNGAKEVIIAGNHIEGNWRQECIDMVSVEDSLLAYNTVGGWSKFSGLTMKAGSRNIEIARNHFDPRDAHRRIHRRHRRVALQPRIPRLLERV